MKPLGYLFVIIASTWILPMTLLGQTKPVVSNQGEYGKGIVSIDRDTVFSSHVIFHPGATLNIAKGVVATFEKGFTAPDLTSQIFTGQGTISGVDKLVPEWFGAVGDGKTDDTLAIQRALNSFLPDRIFWDKANHPNNVLLLRHSYLVSSLHVDTTYTTLLSENAWLIAKPSGHYDHLLQFNRHFCRITGNLYIEGNYNLGYETMIHLNARHFKAENVTIWRASLGWLIGNRQWATSNDPKLGDLGNSEIVLVNCDTVWSLRAVEAIGNNTIVTFADCLLYSFTRSLKDDTPQGKAWLSADHTLIRSIGALLYFDGGTLATFQPQTPMVEVQPILSKHGTMYGKAIFNGCHIEAGNLFSATNPRKIPIHPSKLEAKISKDNPVISSEVNFRMIGCQGYVTGDAVPINTDAGFTGTMVLQNCNFYGQKANTFAVLKNPLATIKVDNITLSGKYIPGLGAVRGGRTVFHNRLIFEVRQSGQAVAQKPQNLVFSKATRTADTMRFIGNYNATTGTFTVPSGGLQNARLQVGVEWKGDATAGQLSIYRNDEKVATQSVSGHAASMAYTFALLDAGDVISVKMAADKGHFELSGKPTNYFQIVADSRFDFGS